MKGKEWLDHHLETFVKPYLGAVPDVNDLSKFKHGYVAPGGYFRDPVRLQAMIDLWNEAKKRANGKTIFLPGRDTWLFEVLARLEDHDTIFRPGISSNVWRWVRDHDPDRERYKTCYGLDSGNIGTILRGLGCVDWGLVYYAGGIHAKYSPIRQLLPHKSYGPYYDCYCMLEGFNKYWTPGEHRYAPKTGKINDEVGVVQILSNQADFSYAAVGTILLANHWLTVQSQAQAPTEEVKPTRQTRIKKVLEKEAKIRITRKRRLVA